MRHVSSSKTVVAAGETARQRRSIEVLRSRAHLLAGDDRTLVEMYLEHANTFEQIARLTGRDATSVARRIRRITRRLADDTYVLCQRDRKNFSNSELAIVRDFLIRGLPRRKICRNRKVTLYRVKTTIRKARRHAASQEERK
jgi:hypothetical protein